MTKRLEDLERQRLLLIAQSGRQRRRLQEDGAIVRHWIKLVRMLAIGMRRATRLYRYWNHSTQP